MQNVFSLPVFCYIPYVKCPEAILFYIFAGMVGMKHKIAGCAELTGAKVWQTRALQHWQLSGPMVLIKAPLLFRWTPHQFVPFIEAVNHSSFQTFKWFNYMQRVLIIVVKMI